MYGTFQTLTIELFRTSQNLTQHGAANRALSKSQGQSKRKLSMPNDYHGYGGSYPSLGRILCVSTLEILITVYLGHKIISHFLWSYKIFFKKNIAKFSYQRQ